MTPPLYKFGRKLSYTDGSVTYLLHFHSVPSVVWQPQYALGYCVKSMNLQHSQIFFLLFNNALQFITRFLLYVFRPDLIIYVRTAELKRNNTHILTNPLTSDIKTTDCYGGEDPSLTLSSLPARRTTLPPTPTSCTPCQPTTPPTPRPPSRTDMRCHGGRTHCTS